MKAPGLLLRIAVYNITLFCACRPAPEIYRTGCSGVSTLPSYRDALRASEYSMRLQAQYLSQTSNFIGKDVRPTQCGQLENNDWECLTACTVFLRR